MLCVCEWLYVTAHLCLCVFMCVFVCVYQVFYTEVRSNRLVGTAAILEVPLSLEMLTTVSIALNNTSAWIHHITTDTSHYHGYVTCSCVDE